MEDHIKQAIDLVKAQAGVREMSGEEMSDMILRLTNGLRDLYQGAESGNGFTQQPPVPPEKAIREKSIICLESGKTFKMLTKRHLAEYGLTPAEYRAKWGYAPDVPLVCKSLRRERSRKMREIKLWERRTKAGDKQD